MPYTKLAATDWDQLQIQQHKNQADAVRQQVTAIFDKK